MRKPEDPAFPPEAPTPVQTPYAEEAEAQEESETETTHPDKRPMESQPLTDDAIRQALEEAQLQQAIQMSNQPISPRAAPPKKNTTAASAARPTQQSHKETQMKQQKLTQATKHKQPPEPKTHKHPKANKTACHTPVKAMPPNSPTPQQPARKHHQKKTCGANYTKTTDHAHQRSPHHPTQQTVSHNQQTQA